MSKNDNENMIKGDSMNTENIIEFIRRGSGLRQTKTNIWLSAIIFLLIPCGCVPLAIFFDGVLRFWGIATTVWVLVNFVCTAVFIKKNSPLKNKLIVGFTSGVLLECFLVIMFLMIYIGFYSSTYMLDIFSVFIVLMPILSAIYYDIRLNKTKPLFSKKTKIKTIPFGGYRSGSAALKLLLGIVVIYFGDFLSEKVFNAVFVASVGGLACLSSASNLDLQCFYYYNKLEKMGLVTEEILKPDN